MMRFLMVLILLAFPVAELLLLLALGHRYGWWLLVYLVVVGYLGLQLIRSEKQLLSAKMMQSLTVESMTAGSNPLKTMLGSARNMVAGLLLLIPGVISDAIAVILLLIPIQQPKLNVSANTGYATNGFEAGDFQTGYEPKYQKNHKYAANDDVIEGEFVEIKEDKEPKK